MARIQFYKEEIPHLYHVELYISLYTHMQEAFIAAMIFCLQLGGLPP